MFKTFKVSIYVLPFQKQTVRTMSSAFVLNFMDLIHLNNERNLLRQMHVHAKVTKPGHVILNRRAYQRSFEAGLCQRNDSNMRND